MQGQPQFYMPRVSPLVKTLLIVNTAVFLLQLILKTAVGLDLALTLGFAPIRLLDGWIWQPITYAFLHHGLFHILFNLLILWSIGSELELAWGSRLFGVYYAVCILGAALAYGIFALLGIGAGPAIPVVGSSGAIYGLLLAYGILYGNRTLYFFMLFPMPARYFVLILGGVELISSVFYSNSGIAHTAHLGGMVTGFLFLMAMAQWRQRKRADSAGINDKKARKKRLKQASHLKLVTSDEDEEDDTPKHWN